MTKVNNLPASAYAKPHTMSGAPVSISENPGIPVNNNKVVGDKTTKTSGIVTRGNGAATKGIMARGPMA